MLTLPILTASAFGMIAVALANDGMAAPPGKALEASLTSEAIEVRNVTPGGEVVLFTAQLEATGGLLRQLTGATVVSDPDRDGVVMFKSPRRIPLRSIWVAVDVETGRNLTTSPDGFPIAVAEISGQNLKKDADGLLGVMDVERYSAELLIVRPKKGAWRLAAVEGLGGDNDHAANGKLSLASADAIAVAGSEPPPKRLKKGDILALIDAGKMKVFVTEVGE